MIDKKNYCASFDTNWNNQINYYDDYIKIIKQNLPTLVVIEIATDYEDKYECTDLTIKINGGNIALRVREIKEGLRYDDVTIRSQSENKGKTEIHKLKEGYGDWYLYVWTLDNKIDSWVIYDLHKVRQFKILEMNLTEKPNTDGKTKFKIIPLAVLKYYNCIAATSQNRIDHIIPNPIANEPL